MSSEELTVNAEATEPLYLTPYLRAAERHGDGFGSLLWASPRTQEARFDALTRAAGFAGKSVLDVGCGRGDFLAFLRAREIPIQHYVGLEAVPALADAAERKARDGAIIVRGDFVRDPLRMFVAADVVCFSGSLNTLGLSDFYAAIRRAFDAAAEALVFNFLASPALAAASFLHWHPPGEVLAFARSLGGRATILEDYLPGDATIAVRKKEGE